MGGTLQDEVVYEKTGWSDARQHFHREHLGNSLVSRKDAFLGPRWDEPNSFCKQIGAAVMSGPNALYGSTIGSEGSVSGPWNSSNAESLVSDTCEKIATNDRQLDFDFCVKSLGSDLESHEVDLGGTRADHAQAVTSQLAEHNRVNFYDDDVLYWQLWGNQSAAQKLHRLPFSQDGARPAIHQHSSVISNHPCYGCFRRVLRFGAIKVEYQRSFLRRLPRRRSIVLLGFGQRELKINPFCALQIDHKMPAISSCETWTQPSMTLMYGPPPLGLKAKLSGLKALGT
ncbi:hypothetical protein NL676_034114 [Syzygium grande]|nr:hypothetical protein NL676_034114 [Syzygium grande]